MTSCFLCCSEWQSGVGRWRGRAAEVFLEPFILDNPRMFLAMICTGEWRPDPSAFPEPFSPDWLGSSRNVPKPTSNWAPLQLAPGHCSLTPLKWAMCAILGDSPPHLDLGSIRSLRMAAQARKTYIKHPVCKVEQGLSTIPMFLKLGRDFVCKECVQSKYGSRQQYKG